jgi:hypothetical protein
LRGKDRFQSDLARGEIEFRKLNGKWKLYYKDRLKDSKILRSISLSSDLGKDLFETLQDETAKDLLTKHGTAEIKGKAAQVPPYIKSQRYFKFVFNALAKTAKNILVPFPEHGSAALGVLASASSAKLVTSVDSSYSSLWTSRVSNIFDEATLTTPNFLTFAEILSPQNTSTICRAIIDLLRFKHGVTEEPTTLETTAAEGAMASANIGKRSLIVYVGPSESFNQILLDFLVLAPELLEADDIEIYSTSEPPENAVSKFNTKPNIHLIPSGSIC